MPSAGLIQDADGDLYGTATNGGGSNGGTLFKLAPDGSSFVVLHTFSGIDGLLPMAGLSQGSDGAFYGTTQGGGSAGFGTIFRILGDGTSFSVLHSFDNANGSRPIADLVQGADGALYGTTAGGGITGFGTVFKVSPDGSGFAVLHTFDVADGETPSTLIQGSSGALYGTTDAGGPNAAGAVFMLRGDGSGFAVLHIFSIADGSTPTGALAQVSDGTLYGTTESGGTLGAGVVYRLSADGSSFAVVHTFDGTNGGDPVAGLIQGADSLLYGTTANDQGGFSGVGTVFRLSTDGSSYQILHTFDADGSTPYRGLAVGADGALYGTAQFGGTFDAGTVFRISADLSTFSLLHNFDITNGGAPLGDIVRGEGGALYGTTASGGVPFAGTVFKLTEDGSSFAVLHSFDGAGGGSSPQDGIAQGSDGALYGTTLSGGVSSAGTIFKVSTDGLDFSVLHSFDMADGGSPAGGLVEGNLGAFYGTTEVGGALGNGEVFKITATGSSFSLVHSFDGTTAAVSCGGLVLGPDGALYGTTEGGGTFFQGTVFRVAADGSSFAVLHNFNGMDGASPCARLTRLPGGLYGTTPSGGANGFGTVFLVSPDGSFFSVLHTFDSDHGANPYAPIVLGSDRAFYGAAINGGPGVGGVIFRLTTPIADGQSLSVPSGSTLEIVLSAAEADTAISSYSVTKGPSHGSLSGTAPNLTYTSGVSYAGPDSFTFQATDADGVQSNTAPISISVIGVPPTANSQSVTVHHGAPAPITLTATDPDAAIASYQMISNPNHGSLAGTAPALQYTPSVGYTGPDSFTFKVTDAVGLVSNTATVSITVVANARQEIVLAGAFFKTSGSEAVVKVIRTGGDASAFATVQYATSDGSASAGVDYQAASGSLVFAPGQRESTFSVALLPSARPNTYFLVNLTNARGSGTELGSRAKAVVLIEPAG